MSKFQELKQELEECACPECEGIGESSDAEAGDTFLQYLGLPKLQWYRY